MHSLPNGNTSMTSSMQIEKWNSKSFGTNVSKGGCRLLEHVKGVNHMCTINLDYLSKKD